MRTLTSDELQAALYHGAVHARRHDPLRILAASIASAAVFFAEVLRDLVGRVRLATTIASALLLVGLGFSVPTDVAAPKPLPVHRVVGVVRPVGTIAGGVGQPTP